MILSMTDQVTLFLWTVAIGMGIGFLYDFLRLFRRLVKHSVIALNLEDGLYWISVLIAVFYFMLNKNYGEIRLFSIVGFFIGMLVYLLTLSKPVLKVLMAAANFLGRILGTALKIILYPVKILLNILRIPYVFLLSKYHYFKGKGKKALHKSGRYAKIKAKKVKQELAIIRKRA